MYVNAPTAPPIIISGEEAKRIDDFTYFGSLISSDNGTNKDITAHLNIARRAFILLRNIGKSIVKQYSLKTTISPYYSDGKALLVYGFKCWRVTKGDMTKVDVFYNSCLHKICNIYWHNKITNEELYKNTEGKNHRVRWLGHVPRMPSDRIPNIALRWTPTGRRKRGRPKTTWQRTMTKELGKLGLTWGEVQATAQDKVGLCPYREKKDE